MYDGPGYMGFFPFGLLGGLACLLFFAGLTLLIVWLIRGGSGAGTARPAPPAAPQGPVHETPLDILARRFASGEITAEEYQKSRDLLMQGPAT